MNHDMGGPAFPENQNGHCGGMTIWDYYAAAALTATIQLLDARQGFVLNEEGVAEQAAYYADAMLAERRKRMEADYE